MAQHQWERNEVGIIASNSRFANYILKNNVFCKSYLELAPFLLLKILLFAACFET